MKFTELQNENRRLVILQALALDPGYATNEGILRDYLAAVGLGASRDLVRSLLAWLAEQGLITIQDMDGVQVAKLTERGADVVAGRTTAPGVKRPSPDEVV